MEHSDEGAGYDIAIVGLAVRVPGANTPEQYWQNLRDGVESVQFYSDNELKERGIPPERLKNPHYIKAGAPLDDVAGFDPEFFGFSPKEAGILDPQHRQFYECAWEALERSSHVPENFDGAIGVFAGCGMGSYFSQNILTNPDLVDSVGMFLLRHTGNDKDFLSTRVSYSFNLKGPSINVQTACSTSAVATHLACQSLMSGECDMALAGGVTIELPHGVGYLYKEGEILSPDGHCRPFDHKSKGTIFGSGTGVIVLRRLEDALEDGDHIHAIISGSAINNDGSSKVGYLAPSVEGQAQAITEALAVADLDADSIDYVECHGTGTPVGDPIEVAALSQAFKQTTNRKGYCGLGSVKSNIGHLDTAAGIASIIKTTLALEHGLLPPSLNYEAPNPTIDFDNSPFYVNSSLKEWPQSKKPRRAAINSLGVGGTNAFIILEEPPKPAVAIKNIKQVKPIVISARNRNSINDMSLRLANHLKNNPEQTLDDISYTLLTGRKKFEHRRVLSCSTHEEAISLLENNDPQRVFNHRADNDDKSIVFMFPGGGAQYVNMAQDLYETEPVFKEHIDRGLAVFSQLSNVNLKSLLLVDNDDIASAKQQLEIPSVQLPAIFIVEYALAQLWISLGIEPEALIGHSMGENTAACISGVINFHDAIGLIHLRGTLMDRVPEGGMLSVELPSSELTKLIGAGTQYEDLELASVNSPNLSVASGSFASLESLSANLEEQGIKSQRIKINIAAHSSMLDGILEEFSNYLENIQLNTPKIPFISNRTGTWITNEQAIDPKYWVSHLRNTVHFAEGIETLLTTNNRLFLEVGPGNTLSSLTRQNPKAPAQRVLSSLRHQDQEINDSSYFYTVLGRLWAIGINLDLNKLWPENLPKRVPLPTYAFQHKDYWIQPGNNTSNSSNTFSQLEKIKNIDEWYRKPTWLQQGILAPHNIKPCTWLIFMDDNDLCNHLTKELIEKGHKIITVREGDAYYQVNSTSYRLSPEAGSEGYSALISDLIANGTTPNRILHSWLLTETENFRPGSSFFHRNQEYGFYSLFFLAQSLGSADLGGEKIHISILSNGMQKIQNETLPYPEKATVLGPCKIIPREYSGISCSSIDVKLPQNTQRLFGQSTSNEHELERLVDNLLIELESEPTNSIVAYRDNTRWEQCYDHINNTAPINRLKNNGVYFITGGLGGIGFTLAKHIAESVAGRLVLVNRTPLPDRKEWANWLQQHPHNDPISSNIRKVKTLEANGANVLVLNGNVTDIQRMKQIVAEAKEHFGEINGVFHAAGHVNDNLIQVKSQTEIEDVFAPKVYGTLILDDVFKNESIDFMVLFSSTSTAIAPIGQVDYVAANTFLNAYAESSFHTYPDRYTVAINWGVWNEVGMAADSVQSMGYDRNSQASNNVVSDANYTLFEKHETQIQGTVTTHIFNAHLSPKSHWLLDEHRTKSNQAILPGTAYIELARAAMKECNENHAFELRELMFFHALYIPENSSKQIRIKLTSTTEGYNFHLQSQQMLEDGRVGWQEHAEAKISIHTPKKGNGYETLSELMSRLNLAPVDSKNSPALKSKQEDHLNFGPRWQVLKQLSYGNNEALAQLSLADKFISDISDYSLHPALLDLATGYAMELIHGYGEPATSTNLWVPVSYNRFVYYKPLTQEIYSWARTPKPATINDDFASFDITLFDAKGNILVDINKLTIHKIKGTVDFSKSQTDLNLEIETNALSSTKDHIRQLSPAEIAFQHNLSQGILPQEGSKALNHVLNHLSDSQVIISSLQLESLIEEADATSITVNENDTASFSRPDLDNDYIEPRNDIEKNLVSFWEELLGVDQVGVEDNFFDLGGHSLIAVRLFAKIQQIYKVDYPISILFESPTVAQCAAMIQEAIGESENSTDSNKNQEKQHKARYTHLVPMHAGTPNHRAPFFLVAGMFGNVLNLRHLAHLIGTDRPFYGLQARGLYGDHEPHRTFEEMAAAYIKEMKMVQKEGPYFIGGFSGGGITAYEITKQLREAGDEVAALILLDTPLAHSEPLSSVDRMSIHWQRINKQGISYLTDWAKSRYRWELRKFNQRFNPETTANETPYDFQSKKIELAFYKALELYKTEFQPINIVLFRPKLDKSYLLSNGRATNAIRQFVYDDNGWGEYVNKVEVFEVPGDHDGMVLEPNVRVLAEKFSQCIKRIEDKLNS